MSKLISFILGLMIFLVGVDAALADKRVALLTGNSNYSTVNRLPNPANDVMAMRLRMPMSRWSITPAMASRWAVRII